MSILDFSVFTLILGLALLILYVYTLVIQARKKKWVWFVLTLLIPPVMFVYWVFKLLKIKA
jgi:hypothetical protein